MERLTLAGSEYNRDTIHLPLALSLGTSVVLLLASHRMLNCSCSMPYCEKQSCPRFAFSLLTAMAKSIAHRDVFGTVASPLYSGLLPSTGCQESIREGADRELQPKLRPHGHNLATECRPIMET